MTRRIFCKVLLVVVAIFGLLVLSGVLLAQGRSEEALEHVKDIQERNTNRLMAMEGVEGTAIGYNQNDRLVIKIFTAGPGVRGIPRELDGVPVQVVVTGKFYALAPGGKPARPSKDSDPPAPPTDLSAVPVSSSQINLDWNDNSEPDLRGYNVYRSDTSSGSYSQIASKVRSSEYSDTGLAAGTTYYYVVRAVDRSKNESANSEEALAKTEDGSEPEPPPEEPLDPTSRWPRPVPIGVSTGNATAGDWSTGTIGCRVTDGTNVYALSNNHVYALEGTAPEDSEVLQPGLVDTQGVYKLDDVIGTLADYEPIIFSTSANNTIDAAIALSSTANLGNATPSNGYGTPSSTTTAAFLRQTVQKYGRTTGLTSGRIAGINATVNVLYDSGTARFVSQIIIRGGGFSAGGDSGSLVVTQNGKNPIGLLFAGSSSMTVANQIDLVLGRFGVTVDGTSP